MALQNSQATWDLQEDTRLRPMRQFQGEGGGGAADVVGSGRPIIQKEAVPGTQPPQITERTSRPPPRPGRTLFGFSQKQKRSVQPHTGDGKADVNAFRGEGVGGAADVVGFGRPIIQKEALPGTQPPQITEGTSRPPPKPGRTLFGFSQKQKRSVKPYIGDGKADVNALMKTVITRNVPGEGPFQGSGNWNYNSGGLLGADYNSGKLLWAEGGNAARCKVEEVLDLFHEKWKEFLSEKKRLTGPDWTRAYERAANDLKVQGRWVNTGKRLGDVPGIKIGDWFLYRAELCAVGLHHQFARGIDYMGNHGYELATSIVVTNRYDNQLKPSGELVYCGEGENPLVSSRKKRIRDQRLTCGNRAMFNSKEANKPVRVVLKERTEKVKPYPFRGNHERSTTKYVYVYDGLYLVTDANQVRGKNGKLVFMFTLKRVAEKPARGLSTNLKRCW